MYVCSCSFVRWDLVAYIFFFFVFLSSIVVHVSGLLLSYFLYYSVAETFLLVSAFVVASLKLSVNYLEYAKAVLNVHFSWLYVLFLLSF